MEITQVPPAQLSPHDQNVRSELRGIDELAATIAFLGILQPLVVIPVETDDGQEAFHLVDGHRRHAAALQVGLETVPCIVARDRDAAEQIVIMLATGLHAEGLTVAEEAAAYEQLALLDWEPERIAKATGRDLDRIEHSLQLRRLPEPVQQAAEAGQVDLAAAATMTEFADDPTAIERILKKGEGYWGFQHAINDERTRRETKRAAERLKAELVLAGVTVTGKPRGFGYEGPATAVADLLDAEGNPVDVEQVKTARGFAAFVDNQQRPPAAVFYCRDPKAAGYTSRRGTAAYREQERAEREAAEAARRAAIEAAQQIRWTFLRERYGTAKAAKAHFKTALRHLAGNGSRLPYHERAELAEDLAGCPVGELPPDCGMDRLTRATVARWLCDQETNLVEAAFGRIFADDREAIVYLDLLVADGYELSEIEAEVHQACADRLAAQETDDRDDDDSDEAEDDEADDEEDEDLADAAETAPESVEADLVTAS